MEPEILILGSPYSLTSLALVAVVLAVLAVARAITPLERRLVVSTAVLLAGVFLLAQPTTDPLVAAIGALGWAAGFWSFLRIQGAWTPAAASRAGPLAAVLLLPTTFLGAVLLGGMLVTVLSNPARLIARLLAG